jgi:hypothetical protein
MILPSLEGYPIPEHTMNIPNGIVKQLYCKMHYR